MGDTHNIWKGATASKILKQREKTQKNIVMNIVSYW